MSDITISVDGQPARTFRPADSPITIGRDPSNAIPIAADGVSARHLTITYRDGGWHADDASSYGTYLDGSKVTTASIDRALELVLAEPDTGARLQVSLGSVSGRNGTADASGGTAGALTVTVDGRAHRFTSADSPVTIGRDAANTVVVAGDSVSARHAQIVRTSSGWEYRDSSTHGSYAAGTAITSKRIDGVVDIVFADPDAGPTITLAATVETSVPGPADRKPAGQQRATSIPQVLSVTVDGRRDTFATDRSPVTIGRDTVNTVVVAPRSVSGAHGRVDWDGSGWTYHDSSTHGTYVDGAKIGRLAVTSPVTLRLAAADGPGVELTVTAATGERLGPAGIVANGAGMTRPPPTGATMRIVHGGKSRDLTPGDTIVLGRDGPDADADLRTDAGNDVVSRRHAKVSHDGSAWLLEDLGSARGTYVDGRRVERQKLQGQLTAWLGSTTTGERVDFETAGTHRKRLSLGALAGAGVAASVMALLVGFALWRAPGDSGAKNEVERMKRATGLVSMFDDQGRFRGSGSSTVLCGDNLVVTNAHVAQSDAPGQGLLYGSAQLAPSYLYLSYPPADDPDGLVEVRYRAEVVTYDGYRDIAVLRIVANASGDLRTGFADGTPIADPARLDLPCAVLPPEGRLVSKTEVDVYGYPSVTRSEDLSRADKTQLDADSNEVTSYTEDTLLGEQNGWINLGRDFQTGNSGGLVAYKNAIYGIPTRGGSNEHNESSSQARPIDVARPIIDAARRGLTGDMADYLTPVTGEEKVSFEIITSPPPADCFILSGEPDPLGRWIVTRWTGIVPDAHARLTVGAKSYLTGRSKEGPGQFRNFNCAAVGPISQDKKLLKVALDVGPNYERHFPGPSEP